MKLSAAIVVSSIACVAGFSTTATRPSRTTLRMSDEVAITEPEIPPLPPTPKLRQMSKSLPFMGKPAALDGSLVGDVGFDPLGFSKNKEDLLYYREAEIKHCRLAMLAAAGWPVSELLDKKLAAAAGLAPVLGSDDRAPSILNGGLGKISPIYWISILLAAAAIDVIGIKKQKNPGYFAGNYGFDPLGLYPKEEEAQKRMQLSELKNGRLAMIAITAFAVQEAVSKIGVVDETPLFFKPILL